MASYGSAPAAFPCWQNGLPHGMGFGLQYYHNAMFLSMVSLLGALPSVQDPNSLSHDAYSSGMASHSSYIASSPMTPELPFTSTMPSSAYMGDQSHIGVLPSRQQEAGSFDGNNFIFSSSNITQRPMGGHSAYNPPNSLPTMGTNPFG
ncbi:hypothetical protein J1N35_035503 [Gossypium stocksii]|uniref:Uncharacterized protein n=1 Tax=Gossypium stocksii TaxID=47602 RepID=A0A9D3UU16_9ROSI|nr:hypothetical protein J1N35_035503 [Gossypium stocksii]